MPNQDTTSRYTQLRLVWQLPQRGNAVHWALMLNRVRSGVPTASMIEQGSVLVSAELGTVECLHEAIGLVVSELADRYPLFQPE